ncbi:MAG: 4Fe-4S dicluster domain-containing protein [Deltaproteobacteria bacterium]|nr:4Fe-4S dicluster domain-containing protein [Deltaproteobacteria bacterium]
MDLKVILVNQDLCTACLSCVEACSLYHENKVSYRRSRIKIARDKIRSVFVPLLCEMCYGHCLEVCPEEALYFDPKLGTPVIEEDKCNGCMICVRECPFGGIIFDEVNRKALKCDLCGGDPLCVQVCQPGALIAVKARPEALLEKYEKACAKMQVYHQEIEPEVKRYKKKAAAAEEGA